MGLQGTAFRDSVGRSPSTPVDGGVKEAIGTLGIHNPSWSPDGSKIVFATALGCCAGGVWIVNKDGTGLTQLYGGSFVADADFSADGAQIVYSPRANSGSNSHQLWTMNSDGSNKTRLTDGCCTTETTVAETDWGPNPNRIVFIMGLDVWTVDPDGQNRQQLTFDGTWPPSPFLYADATWSPDLSRIMFRRQDSSGPDIFIVDADGANVVRITSTGNNVHPSWIDVGCPEPTDVDYKGFTASSCAAPQNSVTVFSQEELDAYMTDFGFDDGKVRNLNVKFNPAGHVDIFSPCEINLAGENGFLDISADNVCVYGRKGVTVAQDASNPDAGIVADEIVLVSEEGNAGFSQGLTLIAATADITAGSTSGNCFE